MGSDLAVDYARLPRSRGDTVVLAFSATQSVLAGLQHVQSVFQLILRDIKQENVLCYDDAGHVRFALADHGMAVFAAETAAAVLPVLGTPGTLAFECRSGHYSFSSDLFAVGCMCAATTAMLVADAIHQIL